jgi:hypothetical protein
MSISSAFHGDDDAKAAFVVHVSLLLCASGLPPRDRNRSQYLTWSSPGFERLAMAIPMSLHRRFIASSPNLLPELLGEGSSGLFLLAVHASSLPPASYKQEWQNTGRKCGLHRCRCWRISS